MNIQVSSNWKWILDDEQETATNKNIDGTEAVNDPVRKTASNDQT
jgi:hypothetical protein